MDGVDVPSFFICPISLQIMKDPVTVSTGITFDRESIQTWLYSYNKHTCPITKQPLCHHHLTPNSNLLRLINCWHTHGASSLNLQAPKARADALTHLINEFIEDLKQPHLQIKSLRKIKSLIQESDDDRMTCMQDAGIASLVTALIAETDPRGTSQTSDESTIIAEATSVLYLLRTPGKALKKLSEDRNGRLIALLCSIMAQHVSYQARIQAALLLKSIFEVVDDIYKTALKAELFEGIAEILKDQNSIRASLACLMILMEVLPHGRNRSRAVDAGIVSVLVELLVESSERRLCEIMVGVLDQLCRGAAGRAALLAHPAGMAAVSSKILKISHVVNDRAVNVFLSVFRFCRSGGVAQELAEVGGFAKMCMVLQAEQSARTKEKAREILGLHLKSTLKKSPCFPSSFVA